MQSAQLPLYNKGIVTGYTLVDDDMFSYFNKWRWTENCGGYVARYINRVDNKPKRQQTILLHREIMKATKGLVVDHINHNKLDNRKANLRLCTPQNNLWNMKNIRGRIPYKGVGIMSNITSGGVKIYQARIGINGKRLFLGCFKTPEEAAIAYNKAALRHFGEFAKLNEIIA